MTAVLAGGAADAGAVSAVPPTAMRTPRTAALARRTVGMVMTGPARRMLRPALLVSPPGAATLDSCPSRMHDSACRWGNAHRNGGVFSERRPLQLSPGAGALTFRSGMTTFRPGGSAAVGHGARS